MKTFLKTLFVYVTFLTLVSTSQAANCVQMPGLVSWWPAEGNPVDAAGGNSGVLLNGATFAPGKFGQAFSFDGSGAHVRIADNPSLHLTNGLTISAWVKPTDAGYAYQVISKWDVGYTSQKSYGTWLSQSKFIFSVAATGDDLTGPYANLVSVGSVPPNQWTHVAATYDGSTMKVYLNGQLDNQTEFPNGIYPGTNDLGIGAVVGGAPTGGNSFPISGLIDEPAIYNRALTAGEIQTIYVCQPPPNCMPGAGLVSWWPGESNAVDSAGGNTGVLLNGATFAPGKLGQAFSLNGSGAHVRIADNPSLHVTNGLTILAWVNPADAGYAYQIVSKWDVVFLPQNQKSYGTWLSQSKFIFTVSATGDDLTGPYANLVSVGSVPPNQWTHVAATYDGSTMKVYLNGQPDNQAEFPNGIFPGTNDLGIGAVVGGVPAGENSYSFSGRIDEPAIFNRALSAAEIQQVFSCQLSPVLSLGLYPGLTINGTAGQTVAIQYVTNVTSTNWTTITNVTLTQPSQLWIDVDNNVSGGNHPRRFYRALVLP